MESKWPAWLSWSLGHSKFDHKRGVANLRVATRKSPIPPLSAAELAPGKPKNEVSIWTRLPATIFE